MDSYIEPRSPLKERLAYALERARGNPIEANLGRYMDFVRKVRALDVRSMPDRSITEASEALRGSLPLAGDSLVRAFALAAEACRRRLEMAPYDEQIIAALVLHEGKIAQLKTGEGKTLAAVLPAYAASLSGRGVQVITANDYLAARDARWMGPAYDLLGARVAAVTERMPDDLRRVAYRADITYLTARQAGFDFLRDSGVFDAGERVQRIPEFAIVDEADFILIDEARIPMVLAAPEESRRVDPVVADRVARTMSAGRDFSIDRAGRMCALTVHGESMVASTFGCGDTHDPESLACMAAVNVALHAHHLLSRDVDYVVRGEKVELVDSFTGRIADRRRWPYGIQTALEVKEALPIQPEGRVRARITVQSLMALFPRLSGMTATATPASDEFHRVYGLATVVVPPHRPDITHHLPDRVFGSVEAKLCAVLGEIEEAHHRGQPVLVGTHTVEESERLAERIRAQGIRCEVLNARNDEQEAAIIAQAGRRGAVTISTNMAGRGTDIRLGGSDGSDGTEVAALGGLYVIGTNRHESRRIDDQLRGRAGRQGDPGVTRFLVSLEDDLMVRYGVTEFIPKEYRHVSDDGVIDDQRVSREILRAQRIIERQHTDMRATLRKYDALIETQRKRLASIRDDAVEGGFLPAEWLAPMEEPFEDLSRIAGENAAEDAAIRCCVREIDLFWIEHLEYTEDLREGIHLQRLGGREPLLVFIEEATNAFDHALDMLPQKVAHRLSSLRADENGRIDWETEGLATPGSTWTYLVDDNPFPDFNLSMIAGSNIGAAAAAAAHLVFLWPAAFLVRSVRSRLIPRSRSSSDETEEVPRGNGSTAP